MIKDKGGKDHRIARGALLISLDDVLCKGEPVTVACTHWDHMAERERAVQSADLVDSLKRLGVADRTLIAGDLNALCRRDEEYGADGWATLERVHASHAWPPPDDSSAPGGCLDILKAADFVDLGRGCGLTSPAVDPLRRIDYIFAAAALGAVPTAAFAPNATGSDHRPVVVDVDIG